MRTAGSGVAVLVILAVACSRGHSPTRNAATQSQPRAAPASAGNACDRKLLTAADVAPSLGGAVVKTDAIPGAPEACEFVTGGFAAMTVTLRPGAGRTTVNIWKSGRMPTAASPLAGVGDDAVWVAELHEVIAQQQNLLCDIQVAGVPRSASGSPAEEAQRIGALCTRIFAAYH
jgi:hypothetical protein